MTKEEKGKIITEAYKIGVPGNKICPQGNGKAFYNFMKNPAATTDRKINEMYENAIIEMRNLKNEKPRTEKFVATNSKNKRKDTKKFVAITEEIILGMQKQISSLEEKISYLELEVQELKDKQYYGQTSFKVLDFNIRKITTITKKGGKKYEYQKWYAIKTEQGKTMKILLGDLFIEEEARNKILEYLKQRE